MNKYGTVEIGGTKTDVSIGTSPDDLRERHRIPTTDPETTLGAVVEFLAGMELAAVGVGSFGPLHLDRSSERFGKFRFTPKPGWSGIALLDILSRGIEAPVILDTDVNAAALGEGRWGAARGMSNFAYVTVGTGIGAGIVVDGNLVNSRQHPEFGHIAVARAPDDDFVGVCPYHGDCLEGLASGPALEGRFGSPTSWAGYDPVVDLAAFYLAQGALGLEYIVAPERIVIGGGVTALPGLHDRIRIELATITGGYPDQPDLDLLISRPGLGELSGLAGGLVLAERGAH